MPIRERFTYNKNVHERAPSRGVTAVAVVLALLLGLLAPRTNASAQTAAPAPQTVDAGSSPVLKVQVRAGTVTIKTWDRSEIGISAPAGVEVKEYGAPAVARQLNTPIVFLARTINSPNGPVALPANEFPLTSVPTNDHQGVAIRSTSTDPVDVQISVPASTALIVARVGRGRISLQNYRTGTFVLGVFGGAILMQNVAGNGYAEAVRGPIFAVDSSFDQLHARTAMGNIFFERCHTKQIQVSSIAGTIVYDNGTFEPGLAHFESLYGNVALGVGSGNAQIGAHSSSGRIFSSFNRKANFSGGGNDQQATLGSNGPVVTASAGTGAVYLYDGAFAQHRNRVGTQWHSMDQLMSRRAALLHGPHPRFPNFAHPHRRP
ncbi:MAG TPA: hypothetical protein VIG32_04280 [Candidatus Baltobacteraceae bacterium]